MKTQMCISHLGSVPDAFCKRLREQSRLSHLRHFINNLRRDTQYGVSTA
jgi:hypothetical protein